MSYLRYVRFVFNSSCLYEGSCLIYVMFCSSLPPVVCRRAHVLFSLCYVRLYLQLVVGGLVSYLRYVLFVFTSSFVGRLMSYLRYVLFLFISSCL
jgi:hypothetical protein